MIDPWNKCPRIHIPPVNHMPVPVSGNSIPQQWDREIFTAILPKLARLSSSAYCSIAPSCGHWREKSFCLSIWIFRSKLSLILQQFLLTLPLFSWCLLHYIILLFIHTHAHIHTCTCAPWSSLNKAYVPNSKIRGKESHSLSIFCWFNTKRPWF